MKDIALKDDNRMTVKEVAQALGVELSTIQKRVKDLYPELVRNGHTTYLTELQVVSVKESLMSNGHLGQLSEVKNITTDLEMKQKAADVMAWLISQVEQGRKDLAESERRNAILMHVAKTYTATEIAKELGFRSATELNEELVKRNIQYKLNGTWVPKADYANLGYFEIKQTILDSGRVVYNTHFTQDGRKWILDLFYNMYNKD